MRRSAADATRIKDDKAAAAVLIVDAANDELLTAVRVDIMEGESRRYPAFQNSPVIGAGRVEHGELAGPVGRLEGFDDRLEAAVTVEVVADEAGDPVIRGKGRAAAAELLPAMEAPELLAPAIVAEKPALSRLIAASFGGEEDFGVAVGVDIPNNEHRQEIAFLVDHLEIGPVEGFGLKVIEAGVLAPELPLVPVRGDEPGAVDPEIGRLAPRPEGPEDKKRPYDDQGAGPGDSPFQVRPPLARLVLSRVPVLEGLPKPGVQLVPIGENGGFRFSPLGPVDGHAVVGLPAVAGPDIAPQIGGNLLPGAEEVVLG